MAKSILGGQQETILRRIFPENIQGGWSWIDYGTAAFKEGKAIVNLKQRASKYYVIITPLSTSATSARSYVVDKTHKDKFIINSSDIAQTDSVDWFAICRGD